MPTPKHPDTPQIAIAIELTSALPWHYDCFHGIRLYAQRHGWSCVLDPFLIGMNKGLCVSDYDGVVGRISPRIAEVAAEHGLPVVNHQLSSKVKDVHGVLPDWWTATKLAVDHLLACGYRQMGYIGYSERLDDPDYQGLVHVLMERGLAKPVLCAFSENFDDDPEQMLDMRRVLGDWLAAQTKPLGLLVRNAVVARYAAQTCQEIGIRVPQDVGIVVNGGEWVVVSNATPTLSSVDYDFKDLGYKAAAMLDRLMAGETVEPMHQLLKPRRVIMRDSSDVFISPDPLVSEAMRFIAEHCQQTLRIEEIAGALNTSKRTLQRHFDEVLGRSITDEISRLRIEHIQRVLVQSDLPLAKIADNCGFGSASHFTQFFRRQTGMAPSEYRAQHNTPPDPHD